MENNWDISSIRETLFTSKNENPFVGLRPYEANEGHLFFGRDTQVKDLIQKLHENRFLSIVGSSGCGKSSLIRAGLIPKLKAGFLTRERDGWIVATMRPSGNPLNALALALKESMLSFFPSSFIDKLSKQSILDYGTTAFLENLHELFTKSRFNLLILVDQFEEIFTYKTNNEEQKNDNSFFVNLLLALTNAKDLPVYTIITMRSDYIGHCNRFSGLPELLNQSQYLLPKLKWQQIREVILFPIKLYGQQINAGLLDLLTNDSEKDLDQLPILQHCLMRTYQNWIKDGKKGMIEFVHYENTGKLDGAIRKHANEIYNNLNEKQKKITEYLFKAITDFNADYEAIRRPQKLSKLAKICEAVDKNSREDLITVIDIFRKKSNDFLTPSEAIKTLTDESVIDISHESLMRQWDKLKGDENIKLGGWIKEEVRSADKLYWLSESVNAEKKEYLGRMGVIEAEVWKKKQQPNNDWAQRYVDNLAAIDIFIEDSKKNNRKKNTILITGICAAIAIIICLGFIDANSKINQAQLNAQSDADLKIARARVQDSASIAIAQAHTQDSVKILIAQTRAQDSAKIIIAQTRAQDSARIIIAQEKAQSDAAQEKAQSDAKIQASNDSLREAKTAIHNARKEIIPLTKEFFYSSTYLDDTNKKDSIIDELIDEKFVNLNTKKADSLLKSVNAAAHAIQYSKNNPRIAIYYATEAYKFSNDSILNPILNSILKDVLNTNWVNIKNVYLHATSNYSFNSLGVYNAGTPSFKFSNNNNKYIALKDIDSVIILEYHNDASDISQKAKIPILPVDSLLLKKREFEFIL